MLGHRTATTSHCTGSDQRVTCLRTCQRAMVRVPAAPLLGLTLLLLTLLLALLVVLLLLVRLLAFAM